MAEYDLDGRVAEKARILSRIEDAAWPAQATCRPVSPRVLFAGVSGRGSRCVRSRHSGRPRRPGLRPLCASRSPARARGDPAHRCPGRHRRRGRRTSRCWRSSTTTCPSCSISTLAELTERGHEIYFVTHPILAVERDAAGRLTRFAGEALPGAQPEHGARASSTCTSTGWTTRAAQGARRCAARRLRRRRASPCRTGRPMRGRLTEVIARLSSPTRRRCQ